MKADKIIKNAKIFTADKDNPLAAALAVKDGKFVYVGDEAGLSDYEGEVTDLGGKFIMPGIFDTHCHVTVGACFEFVDMGEYVPAESKQEALEFMANYIKDNPGLDRYRFMMERAALGDEDLTKWELDEICPDTGLVVLEGECHSVWVNSRLLEKHRITDDTPDPAPGLHYYVRDENGHVTGNAYEATAWPFLFDGLQESLTDEQLEGALMRWVDFCREYGESAVFDAGFPEHNEFQERFYGYLREMDRQGKLPVYVDGSYFLTDRHKVTEAIEETKRWNREFNTEHMKVHTLKIFMDGTMKIHTAAMMEPYEGTDVAGMTMFNAEETADLIKKLNEAGMDLHVHTVGDRASHVLLDGVELARKELGDDFRIKVTACHLESQYDTDLERFAELGVIANYTPAWHTGYSDADVKLSDLLGEKRAANMYRCKTVWDSGALVTWSSDDVAYYEDFGTWNPYLGMEVGMTRWDNEKSLSPDFYKSSAPNPPESEKMSIEEMILGYTINGAKQLGVEDIKGSIEAGKDADFLVFDEDLLTAEHEGFSYQKPTDVYIEGKKIK